MVEDREVKIEKMVLENQGVVSAGRSTGLKLYFKNTGKYDEKGIKATIIIPELSVRDAIGPFTLKPGEETNRRLIIEIPEGTEEKEYLARVTVSNDRVKRVKNIWISVEE